MIFISFNYPAVVLWSRLCQSERLQHCFPALCYCNQPFACVWTTIFAHTDTGAQHTQHKDQLLHFSALFFSSYLMCTLKQISSLSSLTASASLLLLYAPLPRLCQFQFLSASQVDAISSRLNLILVCLRSPSLSACFSISVFRSLMRCACTKLPVPGHSLYQPY